MATGLRISIKRKSRATICPVCQRDKKIALQEQLDLGTECGHENCKFRAEIIAVLQIADNKSGTSDVDNSTIERDISQQVASTLENIENKVNTRPSVNENRKEPPVRTKNPQRPFIIIFFVALIIFLIYKGCWVVPWLMYEEFSMRNETYSPPQVCLPDTENPPNNTHPYSNDILSPSGSAPKDESFNPFPRDPLSVMKKAIFTHRVWKGSIGNDSIDFFIASCKNNEIKGHVTYRGSTIPYTGKMMVENSVACIMINEPQNMKNRGYFELVYVILWKQFTGNWVAYDHSAVEQVKLHPPVYDISP